MDTILSTENGSVTLGSRFENMAIEEEIPILLTNDSLVPARHFKMTNRFKCDERGVLIFIAC